MTPINDDHGECVHRETEDARRGKAGGAGRRFRHLKIPAHRTAHDGGQRSGAPAADETRQ